LSADSKPASSAVRASRPLQIAGNSHYSIHMEQSGSEILVLMRGSLNEDVNFGVIIESLKLVPPAARQAMALDLEGVTAINSCGVREWILFLEQLSAAKISFRFRSLGEPFVEQASTIPSLLGPSGTPVEFFLSPFFCEGCSSRSLVRTRAQDFLAMKAGEMGSDCPKCHEPMAFDGIEDEYRIFLRRSVAKAG
jgi:hypothetical protein